MFPVVNLPNRCKSNMFRHPNPLFIGWIKFIPNCSWWNHVKPLCLMLSRPTFWRNPSDRSHSGRSSPSRAVFRCTGAPRHRDGRKPRAPVLLKETPWEHFIHVLSCSTRFLNEVINSFLMFLVCMLIGSVAIIMFSCSFNGLNGLNVSKMLFYPCG